MIDKFLMKPSLEENADSFERELFTDKGLFQ